MDDIKRNLDLYYYNIDHQNKVKSEEVSKWIHTSREYDVISDVNCKNRDSQKRHPSIIQSRTIYVIDYGKNVGKEFDDLHLGLVISNNGSNLFGDTVVVLPITDFKSSKQYNSHIHHKIWNTYFDSVEKSGLDKNPSKVKIADIVTIDKARIKRKVGVLNERTYKTIMKKLYDFLDNPLDK